MITLEKENAVGKFPLGAVELTEDRGSMPILAGDYLRIEHEAGFKVRILAILMSLMATFPLEKAIAETADQTNTPIAQVQEIASHLPSSVLQNTAKESASQRSLDIVAKSLVRLVPNGDHQLMVAMMNVIQNLSNQKHFTTDMAAAVLRKRFNHDQPINSEDLAFPKINDNQNYINAKKIAQESVSGKLKDITGGATTVWVSSSPPPKSNQMKATVEIQGITFAQCNSSYSSPNGD